MTLLTQPTAMSTLISFYRLTRPGGPGWKRIVQKADVLGEPLETSPIWFVPRGVACMLAGSLAVYRTLFATGYFFYGRQGLALFLAVVAIVSVAVLFKIWTGVTRLMAQEES